MGEGVLVAIGMIVAVPTTVPRDNGEVIVVAVGGVVGRGPIAVEQAGRVDTSDFHCHFWVSELGGYAVGTAAAVEVALGVAVGGMYGRPGIHPLTSNGVTVSCTPLASTLTRSSLGSTPVPSEICA